MTTFSVNNKFKKVIPNISQGTIPSQHLLVMQEFCDLAVGPVLCSVHVYG